jgi:hypothetical protein
MSRMRSSAQEVARPLRGEALGTRPGSGRTSRRSNPLQLDLFGDQHPALPARIAQSAPPALLPRPENPEALRFDLLRRLNRFTGGRLRSLDLTDNRRTILSVRAPRPGERAQLALRIHHSFVVAPEEVLRAVATFVESKRGSDRAREALVVIREHFSRHRTEARARKPVLRPQGVALDLREIADDLNGRYFEGRLTVEITWGKSLGGASACRRRARTSTLQLGSYSYEDGLIRVHRVLDDPSVPRHVVEAVVYHELLHADMPPVVANGRRYFHTPEFRKRERLYRNLGKADAWIKEHLPQLLKARQGTKGRKR